MKIFEVTFYLCNFKYIILHLCALVAVCWKKVSLTQESNCTSSRAFCYSLQHWRKLNMWLTCWVSWEPFVGASDDLWPLSFATGRVRRRILGLRAVAMATFTLPWGGYSTTLLARVDPLALSLQPILITTSLQQGRAQQGTASCCKKTDLLSPTWSLSHHSVEKE